MTIVNGQSRMQWVDAMRGFSMLVVVFGHVLLHMGIGGYDSFLSSVLLTFRMPLFFYVSGFFSYRLLSWWNINKVKDILIRKVQAQIICTLLFLSVYQLVMGGGRLLDGFGGYWFTIVLFQMYLIYLIIVGISKVFSRDIVIVSLIFVSVAFIIVLIVYNRSSWIWNFLCWENLTKYTQFFVFGIICSKYRDRFFKLLENNIFVTIMISSWIIFMILWYNDVFRSSFPVIYSFIHDIAVRYVALMTVVIIFYSSRNFYNNNSGSRVSNSLIFIGQRTLDIYMIHYFLLPNMYVLKEYLNSGNTIIFQILIGGGITAAIVTVCLLVSSILRKSKTLAVWLFGVKDKKALQN